MKGKIHKEARLFFPRIVNVAESIGLGAIRFGIAAISVTMISATSVQAEGVGASYHLPSKLQHSFGSYVQGLCRSSPNLLVQRMEIDAAAQARAHSRSENWYPELDLVVGQTHYAGEPNGFFSMQNDQSQTVGQNGAVVSSQYESGLVTEAQLNMALPLFQEGHWLGSASDETKVLQYQWAFEKAKYSKVLQEGILELGEALIHYAQLGEEAVLQQDLLHYTLSQLNVAVKSADANLVNRTDVAEIEQQVASLKSRLDNIASTRAYLEQKVALWVPEVDFVALQDVDWTRLSQLPSIEVLIENQTRRNPEIEMQKALIGVARYQYKKQRHQNGFKVGLGGSVASIADKNAADARSLSSVGLNVEFKFKEALRTNSRSKYWAVQQEKELYKLNLIKQNIRFSMLDLYQAYNGELVNFERSNGDLNRAQLELEQNEQLYKRGKVSFNAVIESRAKINEAKLARLQSSAKLWFLSFELQPNYNGQCVSTATAVH